MMENHQSVKDYVMKFVESGERTFGELVQSFNQENVFPHDISEVLQELTDEGKIFQQALGRKILYHPVTSLEERIRVKTSLSFRNIIDYLKRKEWTEVSRSPMIPSDYERYSMSTFLAHWSMQRSKTWVQEEYNEWKSLKGSWTRKDKEVSLHFLLTNNDYDHFEMYGQFRRPKGQTLSIPKPKHMRYVEKVFTDWQSLAGKTQRLTSFATTLSVIARGRSKVLNDLISYVTDLDIKTVPPAYRASISPMIKYFESEKARKKVGQETYIRRHLQEHIPYLNHVIQDLTSIGFPNKISPV
jgi:hypothetical protein